VLKAVMIFVDFPDAPAGSTSGEYIGKHLLGCGKAQQLFHDQSYGQLTLDVTVRSDLGWRRLSKPSTAYDIDNDFESQKSYISDAAALFRPAEIRFPDYQIVFVVASKTASFEYSPAFTPGGERRSLVPGRRHDTTRAQPVLGTNGQYWGEGVLVYTVDATAEESPVTVIPRQVSDSPDYGYLYEAPYGVGDVAFKRGPGSVALTVTVLQKFGSCYNIKIEYRRP
jgi:hypothetical protein